MTTDGTQVAQSEPSYAKPSDAPTADRPPFWIPSIDNPRAAALTRHAQNRRFLEQYCHVPPEEQSAHVHDIRERAWAVRTYPCTGPGVWLTPYIGRSPAYGAILARLQAGGTLVDLGCFLGADMRRLAADGAPTGRMVGVDIASHWDVGFALYRDRGRFAARFVEADTLAGAECEALRPLRGAADVVSISAVLHQWSWADQVAAGRAVVSFCRPGALVVGYQIGNVDAQAMALPPFKTMQYRHNPESFARLWDEVGAATGTKWSTQASLQSWEHVNWDAADMKWLAPGDSVLDFVVTRES